MVIRYWDFVKPFVISIERQDTAAQVVGAEGGVIGIDMTDDMLEVARRNVPLRLRMADAGGLPCLVPTARRRYTAQPGRMAA